MNTAKVKRLIDTSDLQYAIFNSRNFSSIATDVNGVIQIFNVGAETMLGYSAAEVVNIMTPAELSDSAELQARAKSLSLEFGVVIEAGFQALVYKAALGIEDIYELTYVCKDKRRLAAQLSVTALRDAQHDIIGYLLIATDNTARKLAKQLLVHKLKQASALQDAIFNSHRFSSIATDAKGVIQIFNVGAETMLGYSAAEVVNIMTPAELSDTQELTARAKSLSLEFGVTIKAGFEALVYKAALGIEDIYELTYVCKDGSRLAASLSVTVLRDEEQMIIGYLLIGTDQTARNITKELLAIKLKKASALQDAIFNSRNFSSIATDVHGVIQIFNVGAEAMLGYAASEVVNIMTPADLSDTKELKARAEVLSFRYDVAIQPGFEALVYKAARGIEDIYELTYVCKDGSFLAASVSVTALRDDEQTIIGFLLIGTDNTARKLAEKLLVHKLKEASSLQDAIFNSRNFSSIATDVHGVIQIFNVGAETMLGFEASEVMNVMTPADLSDKKELKARADYLSSEFGVTIQSGFEALVYKAARGIEDVYELTYVCKNGSLLAASVSVTALHDEHKKIIGYLLIGTDNTARKVKEELLVLQLKEASALQDAIFNSHNFSSIATDVYGVIQIFNVGAEAMLGFDASEVMNIMTPADLSDPDELQARAESLSLEFGVTIHAGFEALIYKAALGIEDIYELTYVCKNGARLEALVSVTALRDSHSAIIGYLLIGTDNTARKRAEKSSQVASVAFESAQSMYITDPNGIFLNINHAFTESTGYSMAELVGKKTSVLNSGRHESSFFADMWNELIATKAWSGEVWSKKKDGEVFLELINVIGVTGEQGGVSHYVVNCIDVSKIKAYELGLIDAKEKAERFSTLKSQFIATMSHEIRTPMAAIIGFSEFAFYEDDPEEVKVYLKDINTASTSLLGILQDILDFTKLEAGRVVIESLAFNLLDLLGTISTLFSGSAQQKKLSFDINRDSAIPLELLGDKLRLQQVLTNLVGNAIKFTAHGSIKLDIMLHKLRESYVQILFSVADTGIGIAHEDQDKLFVEFSQVDGSHSRRFGGTGLGLVISKELVELMGGEITFVSEVAVGSSFSFILQFDINRAPIAFLSESLTLKLPFTSDSLKGHLVLVVEDNDLSQKLIVKNLQSLGIDSIVVAHGQAALEMVEQYDFDAVLMDIHMPIMNGIEATPLIHQIEKYAKLPIIALSAGVTETERNNCIACGMVGFVSKPIDVEKLYAVLELWLKPVAEL